MVIPASASLMRHLLIPALVGFGLVAGFGREILLAYFWGTSREVEIFRIAFGLPSVLSDSLAVSFVSVLIPGLLANEANGNAAARRQGLWATLVVGAFVLAVGLVTMPLQARILAPGITGEDRETLIQAGWVCWIGFFCVIASLPMRAVMSTAHRIWPGAAAPLMRSGGFVLVLILLIVGFGSSDASVPAIAAMAGGATVLVVHLLASGSTARRDLLGDLAKRPALGALSPLCVALGTVFFTQLLLSGGRLMDRAVASEMGIGTLAALEYSYALVMATAVILGTSTNLFLAPRIGRAVRDNGRLTRSHWFLILAISGLAGVFGILFAWRALDVVSLVYAYGAFDQSAARATASIFAYHALSLGPLVLALLLTQVLLLKRLQNLVVWLSALKLAVKVVLLWGVVTMGLGIEGVAMTLIVSEAIMAVSLSVALRFSR